MNLVDFGFQKSNLFRHMPVFDEISYAGHNEEKVRHYKAVRENQTCNILSLTFIRNDEKILWDAIEDFVKRSIVNAAAGVRGVYAFDLLTIDIHKEIKSFQHAELSTVIMNTARTLAPGEITMITYSSVYALIRKTVDSEWGKIAFKTAVNVFKDKPDYLDLLIKELLKDHGFSHDPVVLLLHDLSQNPVFDPHNELQQARLRKILAGFVPNDMELMPEVYSHDRHGARELRLGQP